MRIGSGREGSARVSNGDRSGRELLMGIGLRGTEELRPDEE